MTKEQKKQIEEKMYTINKMYWSNRNNEDGAFWMNRLGAFKECLEIFVGENLTEQLDDEAFLKVLESEE